MLASGLTAAALGIVCGALAGAAASSGAGVASGLSGGGVFLVLCLGWALTGSVVGAFANASITRKAANWAGVVCAIPLTLASLLVYTAPSQYGSSGTWFAFIAGDIVLGLIGAEVVWNHFHKRRDDPGG